MSNKMRLIRFIIQGDSKRWTQSRGRPELCLYTDSLFAQIGDSNDECSNEDETHAAQ